MQQNNLFGRILAFACVITCLAFALSASGEQKTGPIFAVVDFQKVSAQYKANDQFQVDFRKMQATYESRLARRNDMPFLTEDEQKTLDGLSEKATKTDQENAKIKELETKNRTKSEEIQTIQQKADKDLTDVDKAKLAEKDKTFREAQKKLADMKEDLSNQINSFGKAQTEDLMKKFKAAVTKIAEQKGLAIVFNNEVALFAGTDITESVINDLNKK